MVLNSHETVELGSHDILNGQWSKSTGY